MKLVTRIFLTSTLFFFGCEKEMTEVNSAMDMLTFNLALDGMPITRTRAASTDADLKTYGFYLAGYHTQDDMDASAADAYPNVFNHDASDAQEAVPLVTLVNNKFTLKTIKWALDETSSLSFFGWSQSKAIPTSGVSTTTTGIIAQTISGADKGYPWLDIRNADAPADQTDVVGSRSINHPNDAVISAVDLNFGHLLSKLTFKAKSTSKANIIFTAVNIKYTANKVYKKARYTFGSDAAMVGSYGSFAEYHTGTVALNTSYPTMTNGAEVAFGSTLLLPQTLAAGDLSVEVKYKLSPNSGTLPGVEQTQTLPLSAFTFAQGKNYVYMIDVQANEIFAMAAPTIESWATPETLLPIVPGPKGDVLLLLDGYDRPYQHTDNKWYWLDRSGYNNHCEIVGYNASMYSATEHAYTFNNTDSRYLKIPALSSVTSLSVAVIAWQTSGANGSQSLINLDNGTSGTRPFFTHMGYSGSADLYFDTGTNNGTSGRLQHTLASNSVFDQKTMWTFEKQDNREQNIYRNASLEANATTTSQVALSVLSGKIGSSYAGKVSYVQMTGTIQSASDIVAHGEKLADRFATPKHRPNPPRADQILTLNGLKWATGNLIGVDEMNCAVGAPTDYGLYFRGGSLVGWSGGASGDGKGTSVNASTLFVYSRPYGYSKPNEATWANVGVAFNPFPSTDNTTTGLGDPCRYYLGSPWRTPTEAEFLTLNYSEWAEYSPALGNYGGAVTSGWNITNSIFFPSAGRRDINTSQIVDVNVSGGYLSTTNYSSTNNRGLWLRKDKKTVLDHWNARGAYPVRCVSN